MIRFAQVLFLSLLFGACDDSSKPEQNPIERPSPPVPLNDRDGDGVADADDCAADRSDLFQLVSLLRDSDGDGFGTGVAQALCVGTSTPPGYANSSSGLDCDDENKEIFFEKQLWADADDDTFTLATGRVMCIGREAPQGYRLSASAELDCDDQDIKANVLGLAFADEDLDGRADRAEKQLFCLGSKSASYVMTIEAGLDCAPGNPERFELKDLLIDSDGDSFAVANSSKSVCVGKTIPKGTLQKGTEKGLDQDDANGSCWQVSRLYIDQDKDGRGGPETRDVCVGDSTPAGYSSSTGDCNDQDDLVIWPRPFFVDADRDGSSTDRMVTLCAGRAPVGYVTERSSQLDCDDQNPNASLQSMGGIDKDRDGYPKDPIALVCFDKTIHRNALSLSYRVDCDDSNPQAYVSYNFHVDADRDGRGTLEDVELCTNDALTAPPGYTRSLLDDCDDTDATKWDALYLALDRDRDGVAGSDLEFLCVGQEIPKPYFRPAAVTDCNDQNVDIWHWTATYRDLDNDGIGAGQHQWQCLGQTIPKGYSRGGYDPDDQDGTIAEDDTLSLIFP